MGGSFLVVMGVSLLRQLLRGAVAAPAAEATGAIRPSSPVLAGILVSMSNPYWWIWWATVGSAFMVQYRIGWGTWPLLAAFFVGHEAGDLAWYLTVSSLLHWGKRRLSPRLYRGILAACGLFVVAFAVYLAVSISRR